MSERLERREILSSIATIGLAGCLRLQETDGENRSVGGRGGTDAAPPPGQTATDSSKPSPTETTPRRGEAGERIWTFQMRAPYDYGNRSLVSNDNTVFSAGTGNRLLALAQRTGKVRWKREFGPAHLTLAGGALFAARDDPRRLVRVDTATGETVWKRSAGVRHPPLVRDGTVYVSRDNPQVLSAHDAATGETLWEFETDIGFSVNQPTVGNGVCCFVAGVGNTRSAKQSMVYGVDADTGKLVWKHKTTERPYVSPIVSDQSRVYLSGSTQSALLALDLNSGETAWSRPALTFSGPPHLLEDELVVAGPTGIGVFDPASGATRREHDADIKMSTVEAEKLIGVSRSGTVVEYDPATDGITAKYDSGVSHPIPPAVSTDTIAVGSHETADVVAIWRAE